MTSASNSVLRPGHQLGAYPERGSENKGWFDALSAQLGGYLATRLQRKNRNLQAFVEDVERAGTALSELSEADFLRRIDALRKVLRRDGLASRHLAMAFAIVREASARVLGMRHYAVQVMAGRVLLDGMLAEMETGEGKTLMATLPASVAAMAGIPVHVITVNDYLVVRDAEQMSPLYHYLGLTVGTVGEQTQETERRAAYAADITYCTNKTLVFDYLRDRLHLKDVQGTVSLRTEPLYAKQTRLDNVLMRGLCFCIVDEADSVLIDEAGTPLILSQGGQVSEKDVLLYRQAVQLARSLTPGEDFVVDEKLRQVRLTAAGKERAVTAGEELGGQWQMRTRCEELVGQALSACHLFRRDREYLVNDGKVSIIDDFTGRVMADRKWERGLHQMIEVKEGCEISPPNEVLARISYQKFFRRYLHLSGMTGTARETAAELSAVYGLKVVKIPTHRESLLQRQADRLYPTQEAKWRRVVARVIELHKQQRPVLVGTRSVADSETLSRMLGRVGLPHQVLNARQDKDEAELVAQAGHPGAIMIATNMAGRGTDIPLAPGVRENGGLHVIAAERNSARRIDRQLFGRSGRQGAPGSYESILALDDRIVSEHIPQFLRRLAERYARDPHPLPRWLGTLVLAYCQRQSESQQRRQRKVLERMDEYLGKMLAFTGKTE
ncbi:MAG: preprotein translocase subunit SecA [Gammaproteobacteria bacterium]|nr:MAG: preprotein translocase subunit SecA [Gammaproteobacteria bacterium]